MGLNCGHEHFQKLHIWWQEALLKPAFLSLGIAVGSYYQATSLRYATVLAVLGIGFSAYIAWVSFRQRFLAVN